MRAAKFEELMQHPQVELCWLLPKAKQQYRLQGTWRQTHRTTGSGGGPACRLRGVPSGDGPHQANPCRARVTFPRTRTRADPDHFVVLQLEIHRAELLDLTRHPHQRILGVKRQLA